MIHLLLLPLLPFYFRPLQPLQLWHVLVCYAFLAPCHQLQCRKKQIFHYISLCRKMWGLLREKINQQQALWRDETTLSKFLLARRRKIFCRLILVVCLSLRREIETRISPFPIVVAAR